VLKPEEGYSELLGKVERAFPALQGARLVLVTGDEDNEVSNQETWQGALALAAVFQAKPVRLHAALVHSAYSCALQPLQLHVMHGGTPMAPKATLVAAARAAKRGREGSSQRSAARGSGDVLRLTEEGEEEDEEEEEEEEGRADGEGAGDLLVRRGGARRGGDRMTAAKAFKALSDVCVCCCLNAAASDAQRRLQKLKEPGCTSDQLVAIMNSYPPSWSALMRTRVMAVSNEATPSGCGILTPPRQAQLCHNLSNGKDFKDAVAAELVLNPVQMVCPCAALVDGKLQYCGKTFSLSGFGTIHRLKQHLAMHEKGGPFVESALRLLRRLPVLLNRLRPLDGAETPADEKPPSHVLDITGTLDAYPLYLSASHSLSGGREFDSLMTGAAHVRPTRPGEEAPVLVTTMSDVARIASTVLRGKSNFAKETALTAGIVPWPPHV
jgi:hypothetical protein